MSGIFDQIINYAPPSLLLGTVTYKGTWSAATNTPTLVDPTSAITNGNYYVVDAAGTQFTLVFNIGDWIISNGSTWEKVDNTDAISSVFGRTGAVVGVSTDYSSVGITNTALGASNPSTVAATTVTATSTIAATGAVTGSNLSGTNTGDQTISLTGGVTGSGTGSFAATVVTNADLTGDVTSVGNATTLTNAPVIAKVLTGYSSGAGTVAATDSILQAIQKLDGNDSTNADLTGVITSSGNATSIASQTGTGTKFVVDTSPTLVTPNIGVATGTSLAAALNGSLGATTPSTGAFTTVAASGTGAVVNLSGATTSSRYYKTGNNGQSSFFGAESSTGGSIISGSTAYATILASDANVPVQIGSNNAIVATFTSTGLNSTAIGATTPSTVAATTLGASGAVTFNQANAGGLVTLTAFNNSAAATNNEYKLSLNASNNGRAWTFRASQNSATLTDSSLIIGNTAANVITIANGAPDQLLNLTATGLAVTGTLSATGQISTSATGNALNISTAGATALYQNIGNSAGNIELGAISTGEAYVASGGNKDLRFYRYGSLMASITSTGLAVTGTLSATGILSLYDGAAERGRLSTTSVVSGWEDSLLIQSNGDDIVFTTGASFTGEVGKFTSTGLAVTGTLSATGTVTITGASINTTYSGAQGNAITNSSDTSGSSFLVFTKSNGGTIGSVARVTTTDAVAYNTTSDGRLKENLRDFTDSGRLIDSLKPRVFDWKNSDENGKNVVGFVAQEQHAADPVFAHIGAVSVGDDDPTTITKQWQRSDAALIPILVAELQSLRKRNTAMEARLAALESK
jgi:hypothetical protein